MIWLMPPTALHSVLVLSLFLTCSRVLFLPPPLHPTRLTRYSKILIRHSKYHTPVPPKTEITVCLKPEDYPEHELNVSKQIEALLKVFVVDQMRKLQVATTLTARHAVLKAARKLALMAASGSVNVSLYALQNMVLQHIDWAQTREQLDADAAGKDKQAELAAEIKALNDAKKALDAERNSLAMFLRTECAFKGTKEYSSALVKFPAKAAAWARGRAVELLQNPNTRPVWTVLTPEVGADGDTVSFIRRKAQKKKRVSHRAPIYYKADYTVVPGSAADLDAVRAKIEVKKAMLVPLQKKMKDLRIGNDSAGAAAASSQALKKVIRPPQLSMLQPSIKPADLASLMRDTEFAQRVVDVFKGLGFFETVTKATRSSDGFTVDPGDPAHAKYSSAISCAVCTGVPMEPVVASCGAVYCLLCVEKLYRSCRDATSKSNQKAKALDASQLRCAHCSQNVLCYPLNSTTPQDGAGATAAAAAAAVGTDLTGTGPLGEQVNATALAELVHSKQTVTIDASGVVNNGLLVPYLAAWQDPNQTVFVIPKVSTFGTIFLTMCWFSFCRTWARWPLFPGLRCIDIHIWLCNRAQLVPVEDFEDYRYDPNTIEVQVTSRAGCFEHSCVVDTVDPTAYTIDFDAKTAQNDPCLNVHFAESPGKGRGYRLDVHLQCTLYPEAKSGRLARHPPLPAQIPAGLAMRLDLATHSCLPPVPHKVSEVCKLIKTELAKDLSARFIVTSQYPAVTEALVSAIGAAIEEQFGDQSGRVLAVRHDSTKEDSAEVFLEHQRPGTPCVAMIMAAQKNFAGVDLNAANHIVLVDPPVTTEAEKQLVARVHRMGQTRPVTVHHLVLKGSAEERLRAQLWGAGGAEDGSAAASSSVVTEIRELEFIVSGVWH